MVANKGSTSIEASLPSLSAECSPIRFSSVLCRLGRECATRSRRERARPPDEKAQRHVL